MQRRRRNSGPKWLLVGVLFAIAAYVSRGYWKKAPKTNYSAKSFFEVKRADMLISVVEEGALRALNETVIRSSLEGYNRIIHLVPEGAHVEKGELLVELDSSGLRDRLSDQELLYQDRLFQLTMAKENLKIQKSLAESQIKDAELRILNAQDDLEKYRDGEAPLTLQTVESRMSVLKEQVRIARDRSNRTQELYKLGSATRSELEADSLSLKREELGLAQYDEDLRLIKKYDQPNQIRQLQSNVSQAKDELERLKHRTANEVIQAEGDMKTSQRSLDLMEEAIGLLKRKLANTKIFAPQEGLVVYAQVSPFQNAGNDRSLLEGRPRGGRGGGPGDGGGGEFRGGGRRGNRAGSGEGGSGGAASGAQAVAAANQRIASAITGASSAESSPSASGGSSAGGARAGSAASGASSSSGAGTANAGAAFATYNSMRPSSSMPVRSSSIATPATANTANSSGSGATTAPQLSGIGGSQNNRLRNSNLDFDMPVTMGVLEEGIMVRQRQELIRLPDVSKMLAQIQIGEGRVRQVRAGMTAYIRVENIPNKRFKGTVRRVALLPDAQASWMNPDVKVFPTDILVDDELPDLKPGVSARAEIIITNLPKVLSVPIQTVARLEGENVCFVKRGNSVAPVVVTTGWFNDRFVEIKTGLREGDLVLLAAVGDEDMEEGANGDTNDVQSATIDTNQPAETQPASEEAPRGRRGGRGGRRGQSVEE